MSVNDIEDLSDGAKTLSDSLDANMMNLQKQMDELNGAMRLCRQMKEDLVEFTSMDADKYWNIIEEEEKAGNYFSDIARDIAREEKKVILNYLGWTDENGNLYDWRKSIRNFITILGAAGCAVCLVKGEWRKVCFG